MEALSECRGGTTRAEGPPGAVDEARYEDPAGGCLVDRERGSAPAALRQHRVRERKLLDNADHAAARPFGKQGRRSARVRQCGHGPLGGGTHGVGLVDWLCLACDSSMRPIVRLLTSLERMAVAFEVRDVA